MKRIDFVGVLLLILIIANGCSSPSEEPVTDVSKMTIDNVVVPNSFDFATSKNVEITLNAPEMLQGAVFQLQTILNGKQELTFGKGAFDETGTFTAVYAINSYIDTIRVVSNYLGLTDQVDVAITSNKATFDYRPLYVATKSAIIPVEPQLKSATVAPYSYLATYNSSGVPTNLVAPDTFEKNFFDDINTSLPEYKPLTKSHPEYLAGSETNIILTKDAEVWVTFVAEGAANHNALGYYTDPNKELKIIFPNVSAPGSGGGLAPGSKVYLGKFPANTTIGWFLVSDGWNGKEVSGRDVKYSDLELNSEKNDKLKQHMVLLNDVGRSRILLGFEDLNRESASCDNDFNDAIFYVTANPIEAVSTNNVSKLKAAIDTDGDGINDELDDFPSDSNRAFNNYAPSQASTGTLAFEDLWPSKGDYDFNDLVLNYNFNQIANSQNLITSLEATYTITNIGAAHKNGFAIVLPISPDLIESVENQVLNSGYVKLNKNGTEADQNQSVIFVVENATAKPGAKIPLIIKFIKPISTKDLGSPPYNPFIVVNGDRSVEVHLADIAPTKFGGSLLGSKDDSSDPGQSRYYKTKRNLPWALNLYGSFNPPAEKVSIEKVYPKFIPWANSGGTINQDWFK
jgi:LruC domain-containing protein